MRVWCLSDESSEKPTRGAPERSAVCRLPLLLLSANRPTGPSKCTFCRAKKNAAGGPIFGHNVPSINMLIFSKQLMKTINYITLV